MMTQALNNGALDRFVSDGFVLLHQLCGSELVATVGDVCRDRESVLRQALGSKEIGIGSVAGYDEIVQRSPGRWDVPISQELFGISDREMPWWPLIAAVLGADAEHLFSGVVSSEPGSPAQYWHTDSPHAFSEHHPAHVINVLMALHDLPMDMGPTECARGSHVLTNHLSNPSLVVEELLYQHPGTTPELLVRDSEAHVPETNVPEACVSSMAAGSCLAFDDRILHRGLANDSDSTRYVAYFSYQKKGYCAKTHFESQRSVFD